MVRFARRTVRRPMGAVLTARRTRLQPFAGPATAVRGYRPAKLGICVRYQVARRQRRPIANQRGALQGLSWGKERPPGD